MTDTTLGASIDAIYSAVGTALQAEIKTGGKLAGLQTLIRGDQGRAQPPLPALIYFGESMTAPAGASLGGRENWTLPLCMVSLCRGDTGAVGAKAANDYAAAARSTVLAAKPLSLSYVRNIFSGQFRPAQAHKDDRSLFGAVAIVEIEFSATR